MIINGRVADMDLAWIPVSIQDGSGSWRRLRIVLDTGFTGQLALPERCVRQLGLILNRDSQVTPATGQSVPVPAGGALIMWQGHPRHVRVVQAGTHPLLGMRLLWRNHITIDAIANGAVTVTLLQSESASE